MRHRVCDFCGEAVTDAREIIARAAWDAHRRGGNLYVLWADRIVDALTSTGFRILGPDEIDGLTVEKCAEVARGQMSMHQGSFGSQPAYVASHAIADAIRALKEKRT